MSSPGGSGNWGPNQYGSEQYYDPITGQPVGHTTPTGYSGHQQGSGTRYQGFGMFEQHQGQYGGPYAPGAPQPAPPRKSRAPLIATLAITAVGVLVITATVLIVGDDSENRASPVTTSESTTPTTTSSSATTSTTSSGKSPSSYQEFVPSRVPGWQGISWPKFVSAYDIPPTWKPQPGALAGVENEAGERVILSAHSVYMEDFCAPDDGSFRAMAGITTTEEQDPVLAAEQKIRSWATISATSESGVPPEITINPPQPLRGDRSGYTGVLVSATVTPAGAPGPCGAPSIYISVRTIGDTGALFVGVADQQVPGAVPPGELDRVVTSLRRLPE